jgi:hypothetical protein
MDEIGIGKLALYGLEYLSQTLVRLSFQNGAGNMFYGLVTAANGSWCVSIK